MKENRMYNAGKVITGIIIFLIIVLSPFWYNGLTGKTAYVPLLKVPDTAKQCVESTQYMKENHMELLNSWKETAVRQGKKTYTAKDGKTYGINLTGTCIKCHANKEEFCDKCHNYAGVKPYCWDCHNYPKTGAWEQKTAGSRK